MDTVWQAGWRDGYARYADKVLSIGNAAIERTFRVETDGLYPLCVRHLHTGYAWERPQSEPACLRPGAMDCAFQRVQVQAAVREEEDVLQVHTTWMGDAVRVTVTLSVWPELPFVAMRAHIEGEGYTYPAGTAERQRSVTGVESLDRQAKTAAPWSDDLDAVDLPPDGHFRQHSIRLFGKTDLNDTLVKEDRQPLYRNGTYSGCGNLFLTEAYLDGEGLLLVKEAPAHDSMLGRGTDIRAEGTRRIRLLGTGLAGVTLDGEGIDAYSSIVGVGRPEELLSLYRRWYRQMARRGDRTAPFIMANTWGDRGQDGRLCDAFVREEIDAAGELHLDVLQLDDGWQQGITSGSCLVSGGVWEGYYATDPAFWTVNRTKFPAGLPPLIAYAKAKGVELGLWFSPDSSQEFANWKRDVETICHLHETYGIRFFKLDGVNIRSKKAEARYVAFLREVTRRTGGEVRFQQDVTAQDRFGYLFHPEYGTIFVENRYTDWGNYYPHNTLKNLWHLAHILPPSRLQMELLNNRRNTAVYGDDPLAPAHYPIDYLFAVTLLSNPLMWMEVSRLDPADRASLRPFIAVYKQHRDALFAGEVLPVGDVPSGCALTGFQVRTADGGYLLLFREPLATGEAALSLEGTSGARFEPLYTNAGDGEVRLTPAGDNDRWHVVLERPATYWLARYIIGDSRKGRA